AHHADRVEAVRLGHPYHVQAGLLQLGNGGELAERVAGVFDCHPELHGVEVSGPVSGDTTAKREPGQVRLSASGASNRNMRESGSDTVPYQGSGRTPRSTMPAPSATRAEAWLWGH